MKTTARDAALIEDIASYFDMLVSDSEAFAARNFGSKKENLRRASQWREAAADVRSIELV